MKSQPEQPDEFYYPAEGSDIDEEDDSDMEGERGLAWSGQGGDYNDNCRRIHIQP